MTTPAPGTAPEIARLLVQLPSVRAVALGGSTATASADPGSDIDLYVYANAAVPVSDRRAIILRRAVRAEIDNRVWEWGDEWVERGSGTCVDVTYRSPDWIEGELDRVLRRHEASVGYTTTLWHNVLTCIPLQDPTDWLAQLKARADQPYPEPLARAIIAKNHPLLRRAISSFANQLAKATARRDLVSVYHRAAAILASYFDVLFALNRRPHPGEKRLLDHASALPARPVDVEHQVEAFLRSVALGDPSRPFGSMLDSLDALLEERGEMPLRRIMDGATPDSTS